MELLTGLGGAHGFGDNMLSPNDDWSSTAIDITGVFESGLNFYGTTYTTLWVNNNGSITFAGPRVDFTPSTITDVTSNPEISPFWADVDTRGPNPAVPTPGGASQGTNDVYYALDTANGRMVVTWDDVGYFNQHSDLVNAFQLILTDLGGGDFRIAFRYEDINWTTGDASGGSGGLGGTVARAGWTAGTGNQDEYFELPQSGDQQAMLGLEGTSGNTGQSGLWSFTVTDGVVQNEAPSAVDDSAETTENTAVTIDVLANDTDPGGDALTVADVEAPANGSATLGADNTITYAPNADFFGTDTFVYTVSDGVETDTATVTVTVTEDPEPVVEYSMPNNLPLEYIPQEYYDLLFG